MRGRPPMAYEEVVWDRAGVKEEVVSEAIRGAAKGDNPVKHHLGLQPGHHRCLMLLVQSTESDREFEGEGEER